MKRKHLLFLMLMAMFAPLAMFSQETLTVNDGTTTNAKIPVNGLYVDTQGTTSEFIIPATTEGMSDLAGATITKLTFYIPSATDSWGSPTIQVYMGEVDGTTLSSLYGPTNFTVVSTSVWDNTGSTIELELDDPYSYEGGNLLIGTYVQTESSTYTSTYFAGVTSTSGCSRYNNGSGSGTTQSFLPKTTFTYEPAQQGGCAKPTGLAVNYSGGTTATVTWNGTASQYDIDVNGNVTNDVTSPYTLNNLALATTYEVKVRANCGGGEYSEYTSPKSFTTDLCMPEDMCEITLQLTDAYGDGWSGNAIKVVDANSSEVLGQYTVSSGSSANYTLAICDGRAIEIQWVAGGSYSYPDECSWVILDRNGEEITSGADATGYTTGQVLASYTVDCSVPSCFKPTDLAVSNISNEGAVVTWTAVGENQTSWNLQYKKVSETRWESVNDLREATYTFARLEAGTVYEVQVQGNCEKDGLSDWTNSATFTTALCGTEDMCEIKYELTGVDYYWSNAGINVVDARSGVILDFWTLSSSTPSSGTLSVCDGRELSFEWVAGQYDSEITFQYAIYDANEEVILSQTGVLSRPFSYTVSCPSCIKPSNLEEANITTNSADLSWTGSSDSYMLQYRPWNPAGDDIITTGEMVTYTVDLSQYEGTGSVAIRHYDISDMFQLIVDNIEVTNSAGTVVYSQDFENCGGNMPSEFSNMDLDGDGYMWEIASSPSSNVDGTYGIVSASYENNVGPLTPDNWLIVSGIEMGGQMTFQARGQDANYAAENFAIYVSTESSVVEVPVAVTNYNITDLIPNTPYAWQVKGICGNEETNYVSAFFKTLDDAFVFTTAGAWNDADNWTNAYGEHQLPTAENNVRIDAAVTIPAGVIAVANKVTINGGSITIKDGGQLKQSSATLRVTVEKEIAGYGESDGNYYFIGSPFNGRTKFGDDGSTWSLVDNILEGEYDLYAFDATASDGLEWINYKASPEHISFLSEPSGTSSGNPGMLYGEGYLYANQAGTTLEFIGTTGKSNNYSETRDFTYDGESTDDWNGWKLVGNMFTCNGYISYVDANGNALEADFYTLNSDNTYTLMSSNQPLPPCTGALINYSATGKVQYATEAPAKRSGMLNMTVTQNRGMVDQARVRFGNGANLGKMSFRNSSKLYMTQGNKDYAVVYADNQGEMPVSFKAENNGTYTLSFSNENVEFSYLHLIDNMTGNDVDLLETPSYSFEAKTTDYASRFKLVFATGNANSDNFAYFADGSLVINNEGNATMNVYDVTGRLVNTQSIDGSCQVSFNAASGVYMIQLVNGNDTKTQKIVVR